MSKDGISWVDEPKKEQKVIEYLLEENRVLRQQFDQTVKKLRLDNHQRRELAKRGKTMVGGS